KKPKKGDLLVRNRDKVKTQKLREKLLELDPGPREIRGGDVATVAQFSIDRDLMKNKQGGETKLKIKTLGELRSDPAGRLIVIGGMGQSDFDPGLGREAIDDFANNDGWFDDVSDGPVSATLTIGTVNHDVEAAWVLVAPPDFAPPVRNYRTMYDTLVDVFVREMTISEEDGLFAGPLAHIKAMNDDWKRNKTIKDFKPSFTQEIAPLLRAVFTLDRVHRHEAAPLARYHVTVSDLSFKALGGPGSIANNRVQVFERFRDPNTFEANPLPKLDP